VRATEIGVVDQDVLVELAQRGTGLDTQLLVEDLPGPAERLQCVGLPARPVQRPHQLAPQPFPERVFDHQRLQLVDHAIVVPGREVGLHPVLEDSKAHTFQAGPFWIQCDQLADVGQRWPPPQVQGPAEAPGGFSVEAVRGGGPAVVGEVFEPAGVELVW
jgi:hypothetical protein